MAIAAYSARWMGTVCLCAAIALMGTFLWRAYGRMDSSEVFLFALFAPGIPFLAPAAIYFLFALHAGRRKRWAMIVLIVFGSLHAIFLVLVFLSGVLSLESALIGMPIVLLAVDVPMMICNAIGIAAIARLKRGNTPAGPRGFEPVIPTALRVPPTLPAGPSIIASPAPRLRSPIHPVPIRITGPVPARLPPRPTNLHPRRDQTPAPPAEIHPEVRKGTGDLGDPS